MYPCYTFYGCKINQYISISQDYAVRINIVVTDADDAYLHFYGLPDMKYLSLIYHCFIENNQLTF